MNVTRTYDAQFYATITGDGNVIYRNILYLILLIQVETIDFIYYKNTARKPPDCISGINRGLGREGAKVVRTQNFDTLLGLCLNKRRKHIEGILSVTFDIISIVIEIS